MKKRVLFLNLPNNSRVQRRYMCSYNAPEMLFPPIEMLYLAAIAREWHEKEVFLIDAIAEELSLSQVKKQIESVKPDLIVTLIGFEIYAEDVVVCKQLKEAFNEVKMILFGHYPSIFPEETFEHSSCDYILDGEPDINFSNLINLFDSTITLDELHGVYYTDANAAVQLKKGSGRLKKPDTLPLPAHDLVQIDAYSELFLPKPFALIQTARGCPYECNFCVRSFGKKLSVRTPENILAELKLLIATHQIQSFRIIDDTFTATPRRVKELCQLMIENKLDLAWSCLSRADTLNEEVIQLMKAAGCQRIYIGIESGSERILEKMSKPLDLGNALKNIETLRKYDIETTGFFIVGHPDETEEDFEASVAFAKQADFNYIAVSEYICYPGTPAAQLFKDQVDFSLLPYKNVFKDSQVKAIAQRRTKAFYRKFCFRPRYVFKSLKILLRSPNELFNVFKSFTFFLFLGEKQNTPREDYI